MKKTAIILIFWMGICIFYTGHVLAGTEGTSNTFYGNEAGINLAEAEANYSATFIGAYAGYNTTTGDSNTFLGYAAGYSNTTGNSNTFLGKNAGWYNETGDDNTFVGNRAGLNNTADYNTFLGSSAGEDNTTGTSNTFLGYYAGNSNTEGSYNTFFGYRAGYYNTEGDSNVFIGYTAGYNETGSNKLYIDNRSTSKPLIYGEFDNDLVKIHGTLEMAEAVSPSDVRMKTNIKPINASLNKVSMLQGVSFDWKTEEYADRGLSDDKQIGLIAQEVEKVVPELVKTGADGYKSLSYAKLTAVLVEAVKELKNENNEFKSQNNAAIEQLKDENKALKAQMKKQQAMLEAILKNRDY